MTILVVPAPDETPWPTLGPDVCAWIEAELCHGPGDLLGKPVELTDEQRAWLYRMYEVFPPDHPEAGRRRFQRAALSLRKGSAKTEFAAWIAAAELHPDAPVRCVGWNNGNPVGSGVTDPYIPMMSYTEEQTEELAYGALRRILEESPIGRDFDIGLERIMRLGGDGKAEAVSTSPNARDGARTTFQHADETHRFTVKHHQDAWRIMLANLAKRPIADPWALETTTAPEPGAGSVAESTMHYAEQMQKRGATSRLFFFHRQASDKLKVESDESLRAAIVEASGPFIAKWAPVERIMESFREPDADTAYLERVWLNRPVQAAGVAFDIERWRAAVRPGYVAPNGSAITLGFDGSRFDDATALVATEVETGHQWPIGIWLPVQGEVVVSTVDFAVQDAFERWNVLRMYADPPKWETWVAQWAQRYDKRVAEWWTNRRKPMAYAIRSYLSAISAGDLSHDGDRELEAHVANARKLYTGLVDEQEQPLWILRKERPESPKKIDGAMAAILSWEARNDVLLEGKGQSGWAMATFNIEDK